VGYDLLAAIFLVAMAPFVIAGFAVFWMVNARDHDELASCWRSYANQRGFDFVEPEGEWPNRSAPSITWRDEESGAKLRITAIGREARVRTKLTVHPKSTLLGMLAASISEGGTLHVRQQPSTFAQRILTDDVKRMLLGFRQRERVTIGYRRGRLNIEWPGGERNDARLDEARRMGLAIADAIDAEFRAASAHGPHAPRAA
jgi:hypothetical protein